MTISYAQRRMWFLNRYNPSSPIYNIAVVLRFGGEVDVPVLQAAFAGVIMRHDVLRTTYDDVGGEPEPHVRSVDLRSLPWFDLGTIEKQQTDELCRAAARICFDLAEDLPIRAHVMDCAGDEVALCLVVHHIACDGASLGILADELVEAYGARRRGSAPAWAELPLQYADYAVWQREELGEENDETSLHSEQLSYWRDELAGLSGPITLPLDRERPEKPTSRGANVVIDVPSAVTSGMQALARASASSEAIVLQAALAAVLSRVGGDRDIALGAPIAGRVDEALDGLVGFFANTWVLRLQVRPDDRFSHLLDRARGKALAAYDRQDLPFERVVEALSPERDLNFPPLFQVATAWQSGVARSLLLEDEEVRMQPVHTGTAKFELLFSWMPQVDGRAVLDVEYATDIFDEHTIGWLVSSLFDFVLAIGEDPARRVADVELPTRDIREVQGAPSTRAERDLAVHVWNETEADYPEAEPLHKAFERQAATTPDAVAVRTATDTVTYGELNRQANNIAWELKRRGVGPETLVGVCIDRGGLMVAAVLGILKAGGAYLPVGAALPDDRVAEMLAATRAQLVLVADSHNEWSPPQGVDVLDAAVAAGALSLDGERNPVTTVTADNTAYVIFTSGSTGRPKGVQVTHRPVHNLICWCRETYGFAASDIGLCVTSLDFDLSVFDIFGLLGVGASVYVADYIQQRDPELLLQILREEKVSFWNSVPGTLYQVLALLDEQAEPARAETLRLVYLSGDFTPLDLPERVRRLSARATVVSLGGATEATVWSNFHEVGEIDPEWRSIPYGRPISNARYYVLDDALEPCRSGVQGDLYIGGDVLALGYAGQPTLTSARFVSDPFGPSGARLYRTGDRASYFEDGVIAIHGRSDGQVKIRGYRVELGEIEHALTQRPGIARAVVSAPKDEFGERRVIAHVVPEIRALASDSDTHEQVSEWENVYDQGYGSDTADELGEDFSLWTSSYTGEAIALSEMRSWRDAAVRGVLGSAPERVLEIGAGTGLLLASIAPVVSRYWATDVSGLAAARLQKDVAGMPWGDRVVVSHQAADDFTGLPSELDAIVLNSVVQYFPHQNYLRDVLDQAWERLGAGGRLVIGDVRRRRSYRVFQTAVHRARRPHAQDVDLRTAVMQAELLEKELLIDPEFFVEWAGTVDAVAVDVRLKDASFDNELTRHRYEVTIQKAGGSCPVVDVSGLPAVEWDGDLEEIAAILSGADSDGLRILHLRDKAVREEADIARRVGTEEAPEIRGPLVDRAALRAACRRAGWQAVLTPAPEGVDLVDAVLVREGGQSLVLSRALRERPGAVVTNDPSVARSVGALPAAAREHLASKLPGYMIPSAIIPIPTVPLTANGKVDRATLLALTPTTSTMSQDANEVESQVARIYASVLGLSSLGLEDNFFEVGGHSLLATRVASRVRQEFGVEVPIRLVFEYPTVRLFAAELARLQTGREPITAVARPEAVPASFAQRRLWFLDRFEGPSPTYVIPFSLRLRGPLDRDAMRAALHDVVARHEALRTVFYENEGEVFQRILDPGSASVVWNEATVEADSLAEALTSAARRPFSLSRDLPIRADHFVLAPQDSVLLLSVHHIAADGWSLPHLASDLSTAYTARSRGTSPTWQALAVQYADYSLWQQRLLADGGSENVASRQLEYWREVLRGVPAELPLHWDRPRPAVSSFQGRTVPMEMGFERVARLRKVCLLTGTTMSMALQASLAALLSRLGAGDDVPLGAPIAGRTDEVLDPLIGFFVNTWVARVSLADDPTLTQLLEHVRRLSLGAYANQDIPFEYLVDELNPTRSTAHHPLFQVCLALQNNLRPVFDIPGLSVTHEPVEMGVARFDLFFNLFEDVDQDGRSTVRGEVEFATDILQAQTVRRLVDSWLSLLDGWLSQPEAPLSGVPMVSGGIDTGTGRDEAESDEGLFALMSHFEEQVRRNPDRVAVSTADGTSVETFDDLDTASDVVAAVLSQDLGEDDSPVVITVARSPRAVIAMLAAVKLGAPFLVVDPAEARGWAERLYDELRPGVVVDDRFLHDALASGAHPVPSRSDNGETVCFVQDVTADGEVVVVGLGAAAVVRSCRGDGEVFRLGDAPQRVVCSSGLESLAGVLEVFTCLLNGHEMVVDGPASDSGPGQEMRERGADALLGGPELFEAQSVTAFEGVGTVVVTVEDLSDDRARAALGGSTGNPELRVLCNVSGLALVPLGDSRGEYASGGIVDGGVAILDEHGEQLPTGFFGDLCIADTWAGTPHVFVPDRADTQRPRTMTPDGRWWRTGRRARIGTNGVLELLEPDLGGEQVLDRRYPWRFVRSQLESLAGVGSVALVASPQEGRSHVVARLTESEQEGATEQHVDRWKSLYESLYEGPAADAPVDADFRGWVRSADRQPIPLEEMQAWRHATVRRILRGAPRRVLEIGAGTGLLAAEIAEHVDEYWATDLAATSIERLRELAESRPGIADKLVLRCLPAHEHDGIPQEYFDTVIVNSVVQYFPDTAYLDRVLRVVLGRLAPGGSIFVGDVRNLDTHTSIGERERELLVSPDFFDGFARAVDAELSVAVHLKRGRDHNELTTHRYDVVMCKEPALVRDVSTSPQLRWGQDVGSFEDVGATLPEGGSVRLTGMTNRRFVSAGPATDAADSSVVDPEDLYEWASANGLEVACTWSSGVPAGFEAVVTAPVEPQQALDGLYSASGPDTRPIANDPMREELGRKVCAAARRYLGRAVPRRWMPDRIEPASPAGVDLDSDEKKGELSPLETEIARLFASVLELDSVGPQDDFFDLGGSSLQVIRLVWRLREDLGSEIPVRVVFEHPHVAGLARYMSSTVPDLELENPTAHLLPIRTTGARKPLWLVPPGGGLGWAYLGFATQIDKDRPVYALQARGFHGEERSGSMSEVVRDFARRITSIQPDGPYHLAGWSLGGPVAEGVAAELQAMGHDVTSLFIFDAGPSTEFVDFEVPDVTVVRRYLAHYMGQLSGAEEFEEVVETSGQVFVEYSRYMTEYTSPVFKGDLTLFVATVEAETKDRKADLAQLERAWGAFVQGDIRRVEVDCAHNEMMWSQNAATIAQAVNRFLKDVG